MSTFSRKRASITAENQFTDYIYVKDGVEGTVTLSGTWVATMTLQCLPQGASTALDIDTTTSNGRYYFRGGGDRWRFGCKTGEYTSGTATVIIQGA